MKLDCRRCGASIPIPAELVGAAEASVVCPGCGARYTRRASTTVQRPAPATTASPTAASDPAAAPRLAPPTPGSATAPTSPPRTARATAWPTAPPNAPPVGDGREFSVVWPGSEGTPPLPHVAPSPGEATDLRAELPVAPAPIARLPIFGPGQLVGGRYRIVRFIARGGMGEVYEVEDLELRERLALKTIDPAAAAERGAVERFKREIHLARKITHPNVCRIFDVGYHGEPPFGPVIFLTMELLAGETLAARLRRTGRMDPEVVRPIARQMAAGLAAAHSTGVVHRDFKSDNVFLVPTGDGEPRAVVTDFGVARGAAEDDRFAATVTAGGAVVGTPAYMAPEQLEGGPVGPAVDLYALGVVLFEMLTGDLPFHGDTAIATAVKRLTETPPAPGTIVANLEPEWDALVLRCLARRPEERFTSAGEVAAALDRGGMASPDGTSAAPAPSATSPPNAPQLVAAQRVLSPRERRTRALAWIAGAALLVAVGSAVVRIRNLSDRGLPAIPTTARQAVAVLGFRNLTGEPQSAWMSTALAEMLTTEIAAGQELRTIPGDQVARARRELGVEDSDSLPTATLARLRSQLGADVVVAGAYTALGDAQGGLRLDLHLQETATGSILAAFAETGTRAELFALVKRAGDRARAALGASALSAEQGKAVGATVGANSEATRLYAEGLEQMRAFEPQAARALFEQAVALDPGFAMAHSALATAWSALGYEQRAQREAKRAFELGAALPREDRLIVEARYWESFHDGAKASEIWGALWRAFPDNLDYGLHFAAAQTSAGQGGAALAATAALRRLPPPAGEDPRIDLAAAAAAGSLADFRAELDSAARAAAKARRQGARLLLAEARVAEGWAARNLGDPTRAREACEEAGKIYGETGDRSGQAEALTALASVLYDQGDLPAARTRYEQALATHREAGDQGGIARALNNIAVIARVQGERAAARRLYEEVLTISQDIGDRAGAAYASINIATLLSEQGDLAGAKTRLETTLGVRQEIGDQAGVAYALANLGAVARRQGQLAEAQRRLEESLAIQREIGQKIGQVGSLNALGQLALDQGEIAQAGDRFGSALALARQLGNKSGQSQALSGLGELAALAADWDAAEADHREALALRQAIGERVPAGQSRLALARLALDRGRAEAAEIAAREATRDFAVDQLADLQAQGDALLCRALAARGSTGAARDACAAAVALGAQSQSPQVRLATALAAARVGVAAPETTPEKVLAAVQGEAHQLGLVGLELEARLARTAVGPAGEDAAALADDARGRGYLFIAQAAATLAAGRARS